MINLILTLAMTTLQPAPKLAQVQTCQWPNKCASVETVQVQTCVWPNKCAETAQVQTCVWPNKCAVNS